MPEGSDPSGTVEARELEHYFHKCKQGLRVLGFPHSNNNNSNTGNSNNTFNSNNSSTNSNNATNFHACYCRFSKGGS